MELVHSAKSEDGGDTVIILPDVEIGAMFSVLDVLYSGQSSATKDHEKFQLVRLLLRLGLDKVARSLTLQLLRTSEARDENLNSLASLQPPEAEYFQAAVTGHLSLEDIQYSGTYPELKQFKEHYTGTYPELKQVKENYTGTDPELKQDKEHYYGTFQELRQFKESAALYDMEFNLESPDGLDLSKPKKEENVELDDQVPWLSGRSIERKKRMLKEYLISKKLNTVEGTTLYSKSGAAEDKNPNKWTPEETEAKVKKMRKDKAKHREELRLKEKEAKMKRIEEKQKEKGGIKDAKDQSDPPLTDQRSYPLRKDVRVSLGVQNIVPKAPQGKIRLQGASENKGAAKYSKLVEDKKTPASTTTIPTNLEKCPQLKPSSEAALITN